MTVRLKNKTRRPARMIVVNLPKDVAHQIIERKFAVTDRRGNAATKTEKRVIADSVHLAAGATSRDLPDTAAHAPDVKRLVAKGHLAVIPVEEPKKAETSKKEPETAPKNQTPEDDSSDNEDTKAKGTGPTKRKKRDNR